MIMFLFAVVCLFVRDDDQDDDDKKLLCIIKEFASATTDLIEQSTASMTEQELDIHAWWIARDGLILDPNDEVTSGAEVKRRYISATETDG